MLLAPIAKNPAVDVELAIERETTFPAEYHDNEKLTDNVGSRSRKC